MKFKVLRKSYIHDTIYEVGQTVEIDDADLSKDKKGNIDLSKHTGLQPLGKVKKAAEPVDEEDEETEDEDNAAELSDIERSQAITDALETLDPEDNEHWTKKGLPDVGAVQEILGFEVTRAELEAVAPDFTRSQSE